MLKNMHIFKEKLYKFSLNVINDLCVFRTTDVANAVSKPVPIIGFV